MSQDTQPPAPSAPGAGASTPPPPEPPSNTWRVVPFQPWIDPRERHTPCEVCGTYEDVRRLVVAQIMPHALCVPCEQELHRTHTDKYDPSHKAEIRWQAAEAVLNGLSFDASAVLYTAGDDESMAYRAAKVATERAYALRQEVYDTWLGALALVQERRLREATYAVDHAADVVLGKFRKSQE